MNCRSRARRDGEVILDFDRSDTLLGIEVLGASSIVSPELIAAARPI